MLRRPRSNPSRYAIETRSVDGGEHARWRKVDSATSKARALEAMLAVDGAVAQLRQGDLVRAAAHGAERPVGLAVMTLGAGLVAAPAIPYWLRWGSLGWLYAWEGAAPPNVLASSMLHACNEVARARVALGAVACARTILHKLPEPRRESATRVLAVVERWAVGKATPANVRTALSREGGLLNAAPADSPPAMVAVYHAVQSAVGRRGATPFEGDPPRPDYSPTSPATQSGAFAAALCASYVEQVDPDGSAHCRALVRVYVPLSALLLSLLGERPSFRYVRQNPRARHR